MTSGHVAVAVAVNDHVYVNVYVNAISKLSV